MMELDDLRKTREVINTAAADLKTSRRAAADPIGELVDGALWIARTTEE